MPIVECVSCSKKREVKEIRERDSSMCRSCSRANSWAKVPKIRHFRMCIDCGKVDQVQRKQDTEGKRCLDCYKIHRRGTSEEFKRICVDCGDIKIVENKKKSLHKRCNSCANRLKAIESAKKRPKKVVQKKVKKKSYPSKEAIEKQREINKKHREAVAKEKKESINKQIKSDDEMKEEWLKKNKVTIIEDKYEL